MYEINFQNSLHSEATINKEGKTPDVMLEGFNF